MSEENTPSADETPEETAEAPAEETTEAPDEEPTPEAAAEESATEASAEAAADDEAGDESPAPDPEPEPEAEAEADVSTDAPDEPADESSEAEDTPASPPEHTYEELHGMTVAQLREVAEGIEDDALHGYTTMHKEALLPALCKVLGIEAHEHHEVVGIDKGAVKESIRALKKEREAAIASSDRAELKRVRRKIRSLKRKLRKATV